MNVAPMKALLVFDGREDRRHPDRTVIDDGSVDCDVIDVERLSEKLQRLDNHPDVVLLDSTWPAARLLRTAMRVRNAMPSVPVILLPKLCNDSDVRKSVLEYSACRRTSTAVTRISTAKAARYALRRQRIQQELIHLALRDDLTGLYNRRAFRLLASQSLRLAYRTKRQLLMFYADLDGMKQINDRFGHAIGDRALTRVAACLRKTFRRKTDITVRMGGDEFVALAVAEKGRGPEHLAQQIQENLAEYGNKDLPCTLSLSVGFARFDPEHAQSLTDLVAHADQSLYRQKRAVPIAAAATALPVGRLPASRAANAMG